jgi:hypothetical protein
MHQAWLGLQITRYIGALGNSVKYTGSTVYTTSVSCSAGLYSSNVVDQTTSTTVIVHR